MKRLTYATLFLVAVLLLAGTLYWGGRTPSPVPASPGGAAGTAAGDGTPTAGETSFYGATLDPPRAAPDFALIDQHGNEFRLSDYQGDVVGLFFGYTSCPDVCPGTLAQYRHVKRTLGQEAERVQFVFVSVDPEHDTRQRLYEYINLFDPEFKGLTGDLDALEAVWRAYGVYIEKVEAPPGSSVGYLVNHTAVSYVVDASGQLRLIHFYGMPDDQVIHDLRLLLEEGQA